SEAPITSFSSWFSSTISTVCEADGTWATFEKGAGLDESDVALEAPQPADRHGGGQKCDKPQSDSHSGA
ncbi:MAG TPA: hypothetical protein VGN84_04115, partial [Solirubrobacterales bacterium]|nr:hypothetical protein [Solirubrobacterales bacterium]